MAKVTVSDFIVALMDLLEAESRAFQESAELFMARQREALHETAYRSGWTVAWIALAVLALAGGTGFLVWGVYRIFALYLSETAAPFLAGALLLGLAALFAFLAARARG
jgi:hypothetical protein